MIVTLEVPDHLRHQLVYRLEVPAPTGPVAPPADGFELLVGATGATRLGTLFGRFGLAGGAKAAAKLATGRRHLYLLRDGPRIASYGWGTVGRCSYYKVERDAVVIGPIWTDPDARGKGLATAALRAAIGAYVARGRRLFYIDTGGDNLPAQKVFAKCGFGPPIAAYIR